ncbi:MAG: hypothetical protein M1268_01585 [Patescibacteria group bacterium]|nr:hypothetical protein [Patescibacteria group bacterium]
MEEAIIGLITLISVIITPVPEQPILYLQPQQNVLVDVLAEHSMDLRNRIEDKYENEVFSDNIILALHYFKGDANNFKIDKSKTGPQNIEWEKIREPFSFSFELKPDEVFAFHRNISRDYLNSNIKTVGSRYNFEDGYKAVAGLSGNGVCHLASFINWTAQDVPLIDGKKLKVTAKVSHDFAEIPGVPQEFGTSIFYSPFGAGNSQNQNLYIKNTFPKPLKFTFSVKKEKVDLKILEEKS